MARNKKRAGRPTKIQSLRYPNGRTKPESWAPREERPEEARATVIAYRTKIVGKEHAARPEAGYELGRMLLTGRVSQRRHDAGVRWALLVDRYQRLVGLPRPFPAGMDYSMVARGLSCGGAPPDEDQIRAAANDYMVCKTRIAECGLIAERSVMEVCVYDMRCDFAPPLWAALDALGDFFGIPLEDVDASSRTG